MKSPHLIYVTSCLCSARKRELPIIQKVLQNFNCFVNIITCPCHHLNPFIFSLPFSHSISPQSKLQTNVQNNIFLTATHFSLFPSSFQLKPVQQTSFLLVASICQVVINFNQRLLTKAVLYLWDSKFDNKVLYEADLIQPPTADLPSGEQNYSHAQALLRN